MGISSIASKLQFLNTENLDGSGPLSVVNSELRGCHCEKSSFFQHCEPEAVKQHILMKHEKCDSVPFMWEILVFLRFEKIYNMETENSALAII